MAVLTEAIRGRTGGGLDFAVADGATGADLHLEGANGGEANVFAGSPSLHRIASTCAAIVRGVAGDSDLTVHIYMGRADYGDSPEGELDFTPVDDGCLIHLRDRADRGDAQIEVSLADLAKFGEAVAAAAHGL